MESTLGKSKDSWRRRLANLLSDKLKSPYGAKLSLLLYTKAERAELDSFGKEIANNLKRQQESIDYIRTNYPATAQWFTEEKYDLFKSQGGFLVVGDSIGNFAQLIGLDAAGKFFSGFVTNDRIYRSSILLFFWLPITLQNRGFLSEDGLVDPKDLFAVNQLFINDVTAVLIEAAPELYQWETLHPLMVELFKD